MFTIKLQTELTTVAQTEHKWLAPFGFLTTMFDAPSKDVAQTMTTLHKWTTIGE